MTGHSDEKLKNVDSSRFQSGFKGGGDQGSSEKLKNVDSSRFQSGLKGGQDSGHESGQGLEKEQDVEYEMEM